MKNQVVRILAVSIWVLTLGVATVLAQSVTLVCKFIVGNVDRYKETSRTVMSAETMPGGSQVFTNETYSSQKAEKVNSDGGAELIRTIDSTSSTMNGKAFENPGTKGAIGFPLRVKVASTGKVLDVQSVKDSLDQTASAVLETFRSQLMSQPSFSPKPVRINDSWQDSSRITQQTQMGALTTLIKYSTTFTGSDTVSNLRVWVLKMTINLSGSIEGGGGTVDGTGEGSLYFSGEQGREIKSVLDINQTMNVNSPQGSMTMAMKTTTTRELIK
jgi:hypothetical protein